MDSKQFHPPQPARPAISWRRRLGWGAVACVLAVAAHALLVMAAPRSQIAVFRASSGEWFIRADDGSATRIPFGAPGDVPVVRDYLAQGKAQLALFRPTTREWFIRRDDNSVIPFSFGGPEDQPIPGDYLGLGRAQVAVFRPSSREWFIRQDNGDALPFQFGGPEDQPVPGDYLGQNRLQIAIFRPSTQEWFIRDANGGTTAIQWGGPGDRPVPGDYLGLRRTQIAVFRPSTGQWFIRQDNGQPVVIQFGGPDDVPTVGDYDGNERTKIAVFRPPTQEWFLRNDDGSAVRVQFGGPGDVPVPAPFGITPSPGPAPPPAPSNLVATANSQTQITLTWTDTSSNETGFQIERRTGAGAFTQVASVGANVTTHVDTGLTAATTYNYRVRAVNAGGPSAYSNEVTVATQAPPLSLATAIQPIFTQRCALAGCHGGAVPQAGMNLTAGNAFAATVNAPSQSPEGRTRVIPRDSANSWLFQRISSTGSIRMPPPPNQMLPQAEIDRIRQWIDQGANP